MGICCGEKDGDEWGRRKGWRPEWRKKREEEKEECQGQRLATKEGKGAGQSPSCRNSEKNTEYS